MKKTKHSVIYSFLILFLLIAWIGVFILFIPEFSKHKTTAKVTQEIKVFKENSVVYTPVLQEDEVCLADREELPEQYPELYADLKRYNQKLYEEKQAKLVSTESYQTPAFDLTEYGFENNVFGVVRIPVIDVEMPVYLGATWDNMANGFAQLSETSIPIGGNNTNSVLAGHRGWYGMPYMRDVEKVKVGDSVFVQNPWETMEYLVSEIIVISPTDTKEILIQPDRELLTILTCHPYGVGTHRYLLICERKHTSSTTEVQYVPHEESFDRVNITANTTDTEFQSSSSMIRATTWLPWISLCLCSIMTLIVCIGIVKKSKHSRNFKEENKNE